MLAKATIVVDGALVGVVALDGETTLFGRAAHCHGRLTDRTVSNDHLEITRHGDALIAMDLGSRHGTLLNRAPLHRPTRLEDRDVLTLGKTELRIAIQYVADTELEPPHATPPIVLDEQELKIVTALVAPFRAPGALAARPASRSAISGETKIPERTVTRRLDDLAQKLRLPRHDARDRSFLLAQRILEWGLDGQRSTRMEFTPPDD